MEWNEKASKGNKQEKNAHNSLWRKERKHNFQFVFLNTWQGSPPFTRSNFLQGRATVPNFLIQDPPWSFTLFN